MLFLKLKEDCVCIHMCRCAQAHSEMHVPLRHLGRSEDLFQKSAHLIPFCSRVSLVSASAVCSPGSLICEHLGDSPISASRLTSGVLELQMQSSTSGSLYGN